jgi:hypothetical protein
MATSARRRPPVRTTAWPACAGFWGSRAPATTPGGPGGPARRVGGRPMTWRDPAVRLRWVHPKRERIVGGAGRLVTVAEVVSPRRFEGSTAAMSTGCSSPPSQPPPPMATCTYLSPTAALRLAAAGGAGPTRRLSSAGWPRSDCWPPAQSPSPGRHPLQPELTWKRTRSPADRRTVSIAAGNGRFAAVTAHRRRPGWLLAVMWDSRDARACCDS